MNGGATSPHPSTPTTRTSTYRTFGGGGGDSGGSNGDAGMTFESYWEDDFRPLQTAGWFILQALREDEASSEADLYRRLTASIGGSHLYYLDSIKAKNESTNKPTIDLNHIRSTPLPQAVRNALEQTKINTRMGLFEGADLAWMIVDDQIYLWSYSSSSTLAFNSSYNSTSQNELLLTAGPTQSSDEIIWFKIPSGQPIISVGLVRPKPGVFTNAVEWCLVLTTMDEAFICALARLSPNGNSAATKGPLRLVQTKFNIPTDYVAMLSTGGTRDGRVFMGGRDGCLYELDYEGMMAMYPGMSKSVEAQLEDFYDGRNDNHQKSFPAVVTDSADSLTQRVMDTGKRALATFVLGNSDPEAQFNKRRKCRKLNHSHSSIARTFLPDFVTDMASLVFGNPTSTGGGPIQHIVVDDERQCLYTLSSRGWICTFDISPSPEGVKRVQLKSAIDTAKTASAYLEDVARGKMYPSNSFAGLSSKGPVLFPGGGDSAQAGVGGKDGARAILKIVQLQADAKRNYARQRQRRPAQSRGNSASSIQASDDILVPNSIHVIPRTESSHLTLMAVTSGGLRLYLSSLSRDVISKGPAAMQTSSWHRGTDPLRPSANLTLCHIRAPPPLIRSAKEAMAQGLEKYSWRSSQMDSTTTVTIPDGYVPHISASQSLSNTSTSSPGNTVIDSSYYRNGVFIMAALQEKKDAQGIVKVGNVMVAAVADFVARRKEERRPTEPSVHGFVEPAIQINSVPGGISEVVSLPMTMATSIQGDNSTDTLIPGGRIWEMATAGIGNAMNDGVWSLTVHSQTPTDVELGVGLVPPYFPKSKIRLSNAPWKKTENREHVPQPARAIVDSHSHLSTGSRVLQMTTNIFLSRPIQYGLDGHPTNNYKSSERNNSTTITEAYRISKQVGARGFSLTAADQQGKHRTETVRGGSRSSSKTSSSRSARLRPWLLRPSMVPLSPLAVQHLLPSSPTSIVAVNVGGVHNFVVRSLLTKLSETLLAAGVNEATDAGVTSFFTSYGYKEGCAMCLLLAIGFGSVSSTDLQTKASNAAFARALKPKLVPSASTTAQASTSYAAPAATEGAEPNAPGIPLGYEFQSSALYQAVTSVVSRLVRPIWFKPAVVVTEGRMVKKNLFASSITDTPAKVELLLDDVTLERIRKPLLALQNVMKKAFFQAIDRVPGIDEQKQRGMMMMDVDDNDNIRAGMQGQEFYTTRALQYQNSNREAASRMHGVGGIVDLRSSEAEAIAQLTENRLVHSLYRLLSRTVQLLNLISQLRRAQAIPEVPEVDWGQLHGLTFSQLVQTREGQDRVEQILNTLITSGVSTQLSQVQPSAEANQLASNFSEHCYHYFSPASQYSYMGFQSANEAISLPPNTTLRATRVREAKQHLMKAARHWYNAQLITGLILHAKRAESFQQLAERALQFDSPLAKAISMLVELGEVVGAVDIALLTATNFGATMTRSNFQQGVTGELVPIYPNRMRLPWENELYHKRSLVSAPSNGGRSSTSSPSPQSPSNALAVGANVTNKDAIDTCYALIFYYLSKLLDSAEPALGFEMVSVCAGASDKEFLDAFYRHLLATNHKDTLLKIEGVEVENWLIANSSEPELVWHYYVVQQRFEKAGLVAWNFGGDGAVERSLTIRIQWLVRARDNFNNAISRLQSRDMSIQWRSPVSRDTPATSQQDLEKKLQSVDEAISLARVQAQVLHVAETSAAYSIPQDEMNALSLTLLDVSKLYNDYAKRMDLYDVCLQILHMARHEEPRTTQRLWLSVICEVLLPCVTREQQVFSAMQEFTSDSYIDDPQIHLIGQASVKEANKPLFEDCTWVSQVEGRIIKVGRGLYGTGADYVVPVAFLIDRLEGLRQILAAVSADSARQIQGWPLRCMIKIGVPYMTVLDASYHIHNNKVSERSNSVDEVHRLRLDWLESVLYLLEDWVSKAQSGGYGARNAAYEELSQVSPTPGLSYRLSRYQALADALPLGKNSSVTTRLKAVQSALESF